MKKINSLNEIIEFNSGFKSAVNLYLNLNNPEKIQDYIPTKSSVRFMGEYLDNIINNKEQASLFVGPYGKGKSHLLLVVLAIVSMERNKKNKEIIDELKQKIETIDEIGSSVAELIDSVWKRNKYLPVLISGSTGDLNQAFLYALNEAINRDKELRELTPKTYYSIAIERIEDWKENYQEAYDIFVSEVSKLGLTVNELIADLKLCSGEALATFKNIHPRVTSGSDFNPLVVSDVLPLYESICQELVDKHDYSGAYIVFDEFSKFIESQDGHSVGNNMKLIQDICELATESKNPSVFFTMVTHKSIKEYGKYLSNDIINSFTGIEGRIVEKFFVTSSKNNYELIKNAIIKDADELENIEHVREKVGGNALNNYYELPAFRSYFSESDFESIVLKGCYPLNPLTAYLLLNISEKVAQNERTLFTFISNDEPNGLLRYVKNHTNDDGWSVGADLIYDYFAAEFKKNVVNEFIHGIWLSAEYAIEKCEFEEQIKVVKTLAVVLIANKEEELLANYKNLSLCVDVSDCAQILNELLGKALIYKKNSNDAFAFKTRAGSELKSEIRRQRELKGENVNYSKALLDLSGRYYITPRRYNALNCMTRFFVNEYLMVDDFLNINSADALLGDFVGDGKVLTLFSFNAVKQEKVKKHLLELRDERLILVCPKEKLRISKQLKDYEIVQELKDNRTFTDNNAVLTRELPLLLEDLTSEIDNILIKIYGDESDTKVLRYDGKKEKVVKSPSLEKAVNDCCTEVYHKTPIINNEMVNRGSITTGQTKKSRVNIISSILEHRCEEEYSDGYNQEATIYRSLFVKSEFLKGTNENLNSIIDLMNDYILECSDKKTSVQVLIDKLTSKPYGMRLGVIPFYLAYVISERKEDIILYFSNQEVQINANTIINMCETPQNYAFFVSKEDIEKEKYISELNNMFKVNEARNLSSNRIKDIVICMQRWFRSLPQASRNLVDIEMFEENEVIISQMKIIKRALQTVEINPFEILFITFPTEFGNSKLSEVYETIDNCVMYYEDYFNRIQNKVVDCIFEVWGTRREKDKLYHVLSEWYEQQSLCSKQGLYDGRVTNIMSCIENLSTHNNEQVASKLVKAATNVYLENWNDGELQDFVTILNDVKVEIESIKDGDSNGDYQLSFVDKNGNTKVKQYSYASEGTGTVLKNILEDYLDEYDDLSTNDRVSILLELIDDLIK